MAVEAKHAFDMNASMYSINMKFRFYGNSADTNIKIKISECQLLKQRIMNQDRILTFGKYKGQEIKYIILTHIGYIMWLFENLKWFRLNEEEQALYDAIAIMIKKDDLKMTFPVELMYNHIKNREAFDKLETPFITFCGYTCYKSSEKDNPICKSIEKYQSPRKISSFGSISLAYLGGLHHSMEKEIEHAQLNGESDDDIFGGWGNMGDYKD